MAALQFLLRWQQSISGKALLLLLLLIPPGDGQSVGKETAAPVPGEAPAATRDLWWAALPSCCLRGRLGSCPAAARSGSTQAWWGNWRLPAPQSDGIKLTLPSSRAEAGAKGATRTRRAALRAVNTSHLNCLNDALRDKYETEGVPGGAEHSCHHQPPSSPSFISQAISAVNAAGCRALQPETPPRQERDPDPQLEAISTIRAKAALLPSCSLVMPGGLPDRGSGQAWHSPSCCPGSPGMNEWHHPDQGRDDSWQHSGLSRCYGTMVASPSPP